MKKTLFKDVKSHWARKYIEQLTNKKIVKGIGNKKFLPNSNVTRAEYIAMLMRTLNIPVEENTTCSLKDVNKENWYNNVVATAVKKGFITGYSDNTFRPDKFISRLYKVIK
ncbi:MAG: S-layer homology domain-containing protein [Firmicutes bacterium]|nr:S-layer homology domain-containing protein [Bacillota bacterium]